MRSIAVIENAVLENLEVTVLTRDEMVREVLLKYTLNIKCIVIPNMSITEELSFYARQRDTIQDWLIIDHYDVNPRYFEAVNSCWKGKIAYIDDLHRFKYDVNLIINHGISAEKIPYEYSETGKPLVLAGLNYFMLRTEFRNEKKSSLNQVVSSILLTSGGTDQNNYLLSIAKKLVNLGNEVIYVLIGPGFENVLEFIQLADSFSKIKLVCNSERILERWKTIEYIELKHLVKKVDYSISTVGTSAFELIYLGVPVVGFASIDNQKDNLVNLTDAGLIYPLSQAIGFNEKEIENAYEAMIQFESRMKLHSEGIKAIDGNGASRIINTLKELNNND